MSIAELELRIASLEKKLAKLIGAAAEPGTPTLNAWIDQIHGTFQDDAAYRRAARLGREWREGQKPARSRPRKTAKK